MLTFARFLMAVASACAFGTLSACDNSDAAGRQPLGTVAEATATSATPTLPPAALAALDAGNVAYRARQFDAALAKYREAAAAAPAHAAPWFGIYMVANDMKNTVLADSAMTQVKNLAADPAALDAHAEVSNAKSNPMPSGHPSTTRTVPLGHPTPIRPAR